MSEEKKVQDKALELSPLLSGDSPIINLKQTAETQAIYIDQDATTCQALHIESVQYGQSITNAGAGYGLRINEAGNGIALDLNKQGTGSGNIIDIENSGTGYDIRGNNSSWLVTKAGVIACAGITGMSFPGATGLQGVTGVQGAIGQTGVRGQTGVGVQGATGVQGTQGSQGSQGQTGLQGVQGIQGPCGPEGQTGVQGAQGPIGEKGDTGDQGIQGDTGLQGIQGVTGPAGQGSTGLQGVAGRSKTLIGTWCDYIASGYTGIEISLAGGDAIPQITMPYSGSLVAITVRIKSPCTAGSVTLYPTIEGVPQTALSCTIDVNYPNCNYTTALPDSITFDACDEAGIWYDATGDFTSADDAVIVALWAVFDE